MLLSNIQRTKVESKSQRGSPCQDFSIGCYQIYKEQKLKANHNTHWFIRRCFTVVIKYTKNKSWKQITTDFSISRSSSSCYQIYKEQKLKANHNFNHKPGRFLFVVIKYTKNKSWKQITTIVLSYTCNPGCYQIYKEQKLKANHNRICTMNFLQMVVIKYTKNKSWKQITTSTLL